MAKKDAKPKKKIFIIEFLKKKDPMGNTITINSICGILTALVFAAVLIVAFFFPIGRKIMEYLGYFLVGFSAIFLLVFIGSEVINLYREYQREKKKFERCGSIEQQDIEVPYEVAPAESVNEGKITFPNGCLVFLDASALVELTSDLYIKFVTDTMELKNQDLYLPDSVSAVTMPCEISELQKREEERDGVYLGYTTFIKNHIRVLKNEAEISDEAGKAAYLKDLCTVGVNVVWVTESDVSEEIAKRNGISVYKMEQIKDAYMESHPKKPYETQGATEGPYDIPPSSGI